MPLDESRTTADSVSDHVSDHNLMHVRYNNDGWEGWIAVDGGIGFSNSWVNYGSGHTDAAYRKNVDGLVQVRGIIKSGTMNTAAFTLPTGYRPVGFHDYTIINNTASARCYLTAAGLMTMYIGNNTLRSLDVTFDSTGGT